MFKKKTKKAALSIMAIMVVASAGFTQSENPPLPGFDAAGSDAKAVEIADQVMEKMGGRKNWDATRFVTWKFFGRRMHVWDKHTGNYRLEFQDRRTQSNMLVLMNLNTQKGRAWNSGEEITDADSLQKVLKQANSAWINDSYWVFMPYKLKDSGVTLKYHGEGKMTDESDAHILQLTFKDVGDTPQNRYLVYVNKSTMLVEQWDFFRNAEDEKPGFQIPWTNWKQYGKILLSDKRGQGRDGSERGHSDLAVFETLPAAVFENPDEIDIMSFAKADGN